MTLTNLDRAAPELASHVPVTTVAAAMQELFGQKLTAVMAGIRDPRTVGRWARGEEAPEPDAERRLRDALRVVHLLQEVESDETIRAWFVGMNPDLDDRAAAVVIGDDPTLVMDAAKTFLAHG